MKSWNKIFHFGTFLFVGLLIGFLLQHNSLQLKNELSNDSPVDCYFSIDIDNFSEIQIFFEEDLKDFDSNSIALMVKSFVQNNLTLLNSNLLFGITHTKTKIISVLQSDLPPPFFA